MLQRTLDGKVGVGNCLDMSPNVEMKFYFKKVKGGFLFDCQGIFSEKLYQRIFNDWERFDIGQTIKTANTHFTLQKIVHNEKERLSTDFSEQAEMETAESVEGYSCRICYGPRSSKKNPLIAPC